MSLTAWMQPRILLGGVTALVAGTVWLAAGLGNAEAASKQAGPVRMDVGSSDVSSNWAGYAVSAPDPASGATVSYRAISGTWVQPASTCTRGTATYSAFWIGLGGFSAGSQALEQIGTSADCSSTGTPTYSVWYELVPAASVPIRLKLAPGDNMSAVVVVDGSGVTLRIRNLTRRTIFTKRLMMAAPDVSSAEWVAEAPSTCNAAGRCRVLPLANFGTVLFSQAAVETVDGLTGTISNPAWAATPIELVTDPTAGSGAVPGALTPDGGSFSVAWRG